MTLIVYLDETGDHSLANIDKDFPVFVLTMVVVDRLEYARQIVPAITELKFDYFGHEGVVLHSHDVRKAQNAFRFLQLADMRQPFYQRLNAIMENNRYEVIAITIKKGDHKLRYGASSEDPYGLSLKFALEKLVARLERDGQKEITIVAEARGKHEDDSLRLAFLQITTRGTPYVALSRFRAIEWRLFFVPKSMNVVGHQLADLIGYPVARKVIEAGKPNPAFDIVKKKFCTGQWYEQGFKIFP